MFNIRLVGIALAAFSLGAIPAALAETVPPGEGMLHVTVTTNSGPARDATVWITSRHLGRLRMASHRTGPLGRTNFVVPAGAFSIHARGVGGHRATSASVMGAGQERTMALTLHGGGRWWDWAHGYAGFGIHSGTIFEGHPRLLGARVLHRTEAVRRAEEARRAERVHPQEKPAPAVHTAPRAATPKAHLDH